MNLYKKLLEKEKLEKENKRLIQNKRALLYYYKNRDYVLQRQRARKLYNDQYYKEWYQKNKEVVQERRRAKTGAIKRINSTYKTKKLYDNTKKEKPNFTLFG
jgi:hypothetical protein